MSVWLRDWVPLVNCPRDHSLSHRSQLALYIAPSLHMERSVISIGNCKSNFQSTTKHMIQQSTRFPTSEDTKYTNHHV